MAIGNVLAGGQVPIHPAMGMAMNPQAMASQAQPGGFGEMLMKLQQNPAAIQALLSAGAKLLNPQTFQRPGGRIADAMATGVDDYTTRTTAAQDAAFKKSQIEQQSARDERRVGQGDRQLDQGEAKLGLEERRVGQGDRQLELQEGELSLSEKELKQQNDQWLGDLGLKQDQLNAQKSLWEAQAAKYRADAEAVRKKAETGGVENLTGPERIIGNLARVMEANGMPADQAYMTGFDIYNKSGESKAKAISGAVESLGMLATTEKGKVMLEGIVQQIEESFDSGAGILQQQQQSMQEIAPGVTQGDVNAAMEAINRNSQTQLTFDQLTEQQKNTLINKIKERKGGQ